MGWGFIIEMRARGILDISSSSLFTIIDMRIVIFWALPWTLIMDMRVDVYWTIPSVIIDMRVGEFWALPRTQMRDMRAGVF